MQARYGREQVAQIITFGKMKARAVLKDVGRVLQMPYGQIDRLAKLVPSHPTDPWTLARTLGGAPLVDLIVEHSHTCYLGERSQRHAWGYGCGQCPACQLRAQGFARFTGAPG